MNIGINISPLKKGSSLTGIGNYTLQTVSQLINMDDQNEYFLFINGELGYELPKKNSVHIVTIDTPYALLMSRYLIIDSLRKYKINVYWSTTHNLPLWRIKKIKYVLTIYDLANYMLNDIAAYGKQKRALFRHIIGDSCKRADRIVAISEATKNDIESLFRVDGKKIDVVYLGGLEKTEPENNDILPDNSFLKKIGINKPYFLYIGTLQPRKNINTIVQAFLRLKENNRNIQLVLAGKNGWGMDKVFQEINDSDYKEDIILPGFISGEEKRLLYRNAKCVVFPSVYEGFGIPILEAFEYGLPVITASNSSLPEVGGDAALYIKDTFSADELSEKMNTVLEMDSSEIEEIKRKDAKQLSKFSWEKCAKQILQILNA